MKWFCTDIAAEGDVQILLMFDISKKRRTVAVTETHFWDIRGIRRPECVNVERPKISRAEAMDLNSFFVTAFEAMAHVRALDVVEEGMGKRGNLTSA